MKSAIAACSRPGLGGERGQPLVFSIRRPVLDDDVLPLHVAELPQPLDECPPKVARPGVGDRDIRQNPYPKDFPRLVGLGGEGRGENAETQGA
jgi:hypothetical protein